MCARFMISTILVLLALRGIDSFSTATVQQQVQHHHHDRRRNSVNSNLRPISTSSSSSTSTQLAMASSERREVFGLARRVIGVVAASLFTTLMSPSPAKAGIINDNTLVNGRTITFTVTNLGGEEGKTGTFRIQVRGRRPRFFLCVTFGLFLLAFACMLSYPVVFAHDCFL
jgi:hypothetical protein